MKNSSSYFENKECEYYPCHNGIDNINCMFCYCPLYRLEKCPGTFTYIENGDDKIKDCSNCTFPHQPENYDRIMKLLMTK